MRNNVYVILNILVNLFELSKGQYMMLNRKVNKPNLCETSSNALVEQFFNIIFTEFHHIPPVCVCVQMCLERPTYCYPNGCLRKMDHRKPEDTTSSTAYPVNRIQYSSRNPTKSIMFLVDNDKELIDDIFEGPSLNSYTGRKEKYSSSELILRPNPFKELVFKYRKLPKFEMRYNLREKLKNTRSDKVKSDKLDVSKTRWPMNRHLLHGKPLLSKIRHYKKDNEDRLTFSEIDSASNMPILNKKSLNKREDSNVIKMDSLYVYKPDFANFSLENLIDDLIINTLDNNNNDIKLNLNLPLDSSVTTTKLIDHITDGTVLQNTAMPRNDNNNRAVSIILINSTNKDIDKNKYMRSVNSTYNKTYLEMIATMSKEIEKNNNMSIEFARHVTGWKSLKNLRRNSSINTSENLLPYDMKNNDSDCNTDSHDKTDTTESITTLSGQLNTTNIRWTSPILKTTNKRNNNQRIVRKIDRKHIL